MSILGLWGKGLMALGPAIIAITLFFMGREPRPRNYSTFCSYNGLIYSRGTHTRTADGLLECTADGWAPTYQAACQLPPTDSERPASSPAIDKDK